MKIALIGQKGIPAISGGIEKHVENLAVNLLEHGHEVYVYTRPNYTDKKLKEYRGIKLISLPSIPTKHLDTISHTFLACLDVIFHRNFDVIHFHSIGPSSLIWFVKLFKPNTPVIATFHSQCYYHKKWNAFARFYLRVGEKSLCQIADKVITVSKILKSYCREEYGRNAIYLPNGVNQVECLPPNKIRKNWGLEKDGYIVYIGRLIEHKGVHYLIKAFNKLKTDKKLVIAGSGHFTDKYTNCLYEIASENPNIIFTGEVFDEVLEELYSNAYIFVQPSESEGLSIALLEAMSYGSAVLVSDIPENREAIGNVGFVFRNRDIDDLRDKIEILLSQPDLVEKEKVSGVERIKKYYNWKDIARGTSELYRYMYAKKNGEPEKIPFFKKPLY